MRRRNPLTTQTRIQREIASNQRPQYPIEYIQQQTISHTPKQAISYVPQQAISHAPQQQQQAISHTP